ncbi:MAG TPA: hypothetical protein VFR18_17020 [Terriglobia bacterium]|nr:hypothetical protein [Terriglobia bacterium]
MPNRLQWGRIIIGALLVEIALIIVFIPLLAVADIQTLIPFVVPAVFVFGFAITWWLVRKVRGQHVLHGILIGIIATLLYLLLCMAQPDGISSVVAMYGTSVFILANLLRILGCAAGAFAARPRT